MGGARGAPVLAAESSTWESKILVDRNINRKNGKIKGGALGIGIFSSIFKEGNAAKIRKFQKS